MKNPFRAGENSVAILAEAKRRTEERLNVHIEDDLDSSLFFRMVEDANARFAENIYGDDADRIFNDALFARGCSLEPIRTAMKCALGILYGSRRQKNVRTSSVR